MSMLYCLAFSLIAVIESHAYSSNLFFVAYVHIAHVPGIRVLQSSGCRKFKKIGFQ